MKLTCLLAFSCPFSMAGITVPIFLNSSWYTNDDECDLSAPSLEDRCNSTLKEPIRKLASREPIHCTLSDRDLFPTLQSSIRRHRGLGNCSTLAINPCVIKRIELIICENRLERSVAFLLAETIRLSSLLTL